MHDDPTRTMGQPGPPDGRPHGNLRLLIAGLVAVIVGLVVAILVIASDGDGNGAAETPPEVTLPVEPTTEGTTTAPTTETTTGTTTAPTTTTETTETTTTAPTTPTSPEDDGSGGLEAP